MLSCEVSVGAVGGDGRLIHWYKDRCPMLVALARRRLSQRFGGVRQEAGGGGVAVWQSQEDVT